MNLASILTMVVYFAFIFGIFYFIGIRPQKKEQKKHQEMINSMAIGDYCVTSSGFYGQIIDITNDMVIVEFGNKNCRIPMLKSAVSRLEKPQATVNGVSEK
ncbi:MAG: preprotein translocase subunit YajC [Eubacteriales bacterium]|nr:preprotein translocase subunit YajC [Eubacteriales bacterium]